MLKQLAAFGIGAALMLAPLAAYADDAPTPAPTPTSTAKPMVHHHKAKHVVKKPMAKKPMAKKPMMMKPTPTETPKS